MVEEKLEEVTARLSKLLVKDWFDWLDWVEQFGAFTGESKGCYSVPYYEARTNNTVYVLHKIRKVKDGTIEAPYIKVGEGQILEGDMVKDLYNEIDRKMRAAGKVRDYCS